MAYGNGFPVGYPYFSQQPQQYTGMYPTQMSGTYQAGQQQQQQQLMTPPTIHAEIVQVSGKDEAASWPVGAGQSQMMMARDDSAIYIKTVYANGQTGFIEYSREQPKAEQPPDYVTRQEFEERLAELAKPRSKPKKEAVPQDEPSI